MCGKHGSMEAYTKFVLKCMWIDRSC